MKKHIREAEAEEAWSRGSTKQREREAEEARCPETEGEGARGPETEAEGARCPETAMVCTQGLKHVNSLK